MKKKYKKILAALIVVICLAVFGISLFKPVTAKMEVVRYGNLEKSFTVQAELTPVHSMILSAPAAGSVSDVPFKPGSQVRAGEVLLRTETVLEISTDIQNEQLKQQLSLAKQEYDRLYGTNGEAASSYEAADRSYRLSKKNYEAGKVLADDGYLSRTELEMLELEMVQAHQQYLQAEEINSERQRDYMIEQIASCERQLNTLNEAVGGAEIRMPYDGILWEVYTERGAFLAQNQAAVKIYRDDGMKLSASVLAEDVSGIVPGTVAEAVYPDGTKGQVQVTFVARTASKELSSTGLEESRCQVELEPWEEAMQGVEPGIFNTGFGAGQQADVTFRIIKAKDVLTVPVSAIVPDGKRAIVYRDKNGKAEAVAVKAGRTENGRTEILDGLSEGDKIVSDPYEAGVENGERVRNGPETV